MDEGVLTLQQFREYSRRVDAEDERQNRRLEALENSVKEMHGLTLSVERMAANMENMLSAIERQGTLIEKQGERLEKIEREPAEAGKKMREIIATAFVGTLVGAVATAFIALLL